MGRFFEFKNVVNKSADLYLYGEIVRDKDEYWDDETDVSLLDFKQALDDIGDIDNLNMFINSPGGDVFVTSTMISMLRRIKAKGTFITAYVDGISASAASFLMMIANKIIVYKNSIAVLHKPMTRVQGNVDKLQKLIDALNAIESGIMMPLYMEKAKAKEEEIASLIAAETWLDAEGMEKYFDVTVLEEEKLAVASIESDLFKNYKNITENIKNMLESGLKTPEGKIEPVADKSPENKEEESLKVDENAFKEDEQKQKVARARLKLIKNGLMLKDLGEKERLTNE